MTYSANLYIWMYIYLCMKSTRKSAFKKMKTSISNKRNRIKLDPNNALFYRKKGYVLDELERFEEAILACEQAIQLDPNHAVAYANKDVAFENLNLDREAQKAYARARDLGWED